MLHEPNRGEASAHRDRVGVGQHGEQRRRVALGEQRGDVRPRRRPCSAAAVAASTLTKPWWVKPVSGSMCRTAWCRPAVSLNGSARSRQAR